MPVRKDEKAKKDPWYFEFEAGKDAATGKRIRVKQRGFKTKKEAEKAMIDARSKYNNGTYIEPSKMLYGEYLQSWLKNKKDINGQTRGLYETALRVHIMPALGNIPLAKLTPLAIQSFVSGLSDKGLSASTIKRLFSIVNTSLNAAEKLDLVQRNVASRIEKPKVPRKDMKVWDIETVIRMLALAKETTRFYAGIYLAIMTGMRQGEILGLRWSDIDIETGILRIVRTVSHNGKVIQSGAKTAGSVRTVAISPATVRVLSEHKEILEEEKKLIGSNYEDMDLVICTARGTLCHPRVLYKAWRRVLEKGNFPHITYHDLRHTHASLLLKAKVHPKVVSERLGHASVTITLDTYSHLMPHMQEEAAKDFDKLLFG